MKRYPLTSGIPQRGPIRCGEHWRVCQQLFWSEADAMIHVLDTGHKLKVPPGYCDLKGHDFRERTSPVDGGHIEAFACASCGTPKIKLEDGLTRTVESIS